MTNFEIAKQYLGKGFSVIPVWSPAELKRQDKNYNKAEGEVQEKCLHASQLTEMEIIKKSKVPIGNWKIFQKKMPSIEYLGNVFSAYPEANMAIITGSLSNITVLDFDRPDLYELAKKIGVLDNSITVLTGKGHHCAFLYCNHELLGGTKNNVIEKFDTRSEGGYFVVPPSIHGNGKKYRWISDEITLLSTSLKPIDLQLYIKFLKEAGYEPKNKIKNKTKKSNTAKNSVNNFSQAIDVNLIPVKDKFKKLIVDGNDGSYKSNSEADLAVISVLVKKGYDFNSIKRIFEQFGIGKKYRAHLSKEAYLRATYDKAVQLSELNEDEIADPLFISESLIKENSKIKLNITKFQEFVSDKHNIKVIEDSGAIYKYNGKSYDLCLEMAIKKICQDELPNRRNLYTRTCHDDFFHYLYGSSRHIFSKESLATDMKYIGMQNGIFNLENGNIIPHSSNYFMTNLLPYNYDKAAQSPRFIKFLNEIFYDDPRKAIFMQEAAGYCLHKSMPIHSMFFLEGGGSNGKSVFLDILSEMLGTGNVSKISLSNLSDEKHVVDIIDKMANFCTECPTEKDISSELLKAISSGDTIVGRKIYKDPVYIKPYVKMFFAMNSLPKIRDTSNGLLRRIYHIRFNKTFTIEEQDNALIDKLRNELPGIFNWAYEGYLCLRKNNFKFSNYAIFQKSYRDALLEQNPVLDYISSNFIHDDGNRIKLNTIVNLCKANIGDRNNDVTLGVVKMALIKLGYEFKNNSTLDNNYKMVLDISPKV